MIEAIQARIDSESILIIHRHVTAKIHYRDVLELYAWQKFNIPSDFVTPMVRVSRVAGGVTLRLRGEQQTQQEVDCPAEVAAQLITNLCRLAKQVEALTNAKNLIAEQAFLLQQPVGLCITPDVRIFNEATKLLGGAGHVPEQLIGLPQIISPSSGA